MVLLSKDETLNQLLKLLETLTHSAGRRPCLHPSDETASFFGIVNISTAWINIFCSELNFFGSVGIRRVAAINPNEFAVVACCIYRSLQIRIDARKQRRVKNKFYTCFISNQCFTTLYLWPSDKVTLSPSLLQTIFGIPGVFKSKSLISKWTGALEKVTEVLYKPHGYGLSVYVFINGPEQGGTSTDSSLSLSTIASPHSAGYN